MRLSTDYYPEYVDMYCLKCDRDYGNVRVDSIEGDDVRVECPTCDEPKYIQVIF